jgi:transposase-like protein
MRISDGQRSFYVDVDQLYRLTNQLILLKDKSFDAIKSFMQETIDSCRVEKALIIVTAPQYDVLLSLNQK